MSSELFLFNVSFVVGFFGGVFGAFGFWKLVLVPWSQARQKAVVEYINAGIADFQQEVAANKALPRKTRLPRASASAENLPADGKGQS